MGIICGSEHTRNAYTSNQLVSVSDDIDLRDPGSTNIDIERTSTSMLPAHSPQILRITSTTTRTLHNPCLMTQLMRFQAAVVAVRHPAQAAQRLPLVHNHSYTTGNSNKCRLCHGPTSTHAPTPRPAAVPHVLCARDSRDDDVAAHSGIFHAGAFEHFTSPMTRSPFRSLCTFTSS